MYVYYYRGFPYNFEFDAIKLMKLNEKYEYEGGFSKYVDKAVVENDYLRMVKAVTDIVECSFCGDIFDEPRYGEKKFAFSALTNQLILDSNRLKEFVEKVLPNQLIKKEEKDMASISYETYERLFQPRASQCTIRNTNPIGRITPRMVSVDKVVTHNDRVVIVYFSDGTFTKSVCSVNDKFDIDVGITICILKKMLGGTKHYNDLIRNIHKKMDKIEAEKAKDSEEKKAHREKQKKLHEKREQKQKEYVEQYKCDIADAVLFALQKYDEMNGDDAK